AKDGIWNKGDSNAANNDIALGGIKFDLYKFIKSTTKQPASGGSPITTYFWEDVGDATSDSHGEFWFTKLDPGTYEVRERAGQTDANGSLYSLTTGQANNAIPASSSDAAFNPDTSVSKFVIVSRREFGWEADADGLNNSGINNKFGAINRPMDTNG